MATSGDFYLAIDTEAGKWRSLSDSINRAADARAKGDFKSVVPSLTGNPLNKNAIGTAYSSGGSTLVGEHGPEIVDMPRGAQVTQAYRTQSVLSQNAGGGDTNVYITGPISFNNRSDIDYFAERISATQRLAMKGMA